MEKQTNNIARLLSTCFLTIFALTILLIHGEISPVNAQTPTGTLQICIAENENLRNRVFYFRVDSLIVQVQTGNCSNVTEVPAGSVKIEETQDGLMRPSGTFSGRFRLLKVTAIGDGILESVDLNKRTATVNVRAGGIENKTAVVFTNTPALKTVVEICARAEPNAARLFHFTVDVLPDTVISVPANSCSELFQVNAPSHLSSFPAEADITVTQLRTKGYSLDKAEVTTGATSDTNRLNELVKGKGVRNTLDCIDERRASTNSKVLFDYALSDVCFFDNSGGGYASADVLEGGSASKTTFTFFNINQRIGRKQF